MTRLHQAIIAAVLLTFAVVPVRAESPRGRFLELIPPDAIAVIGTTNLRHANDHFTQMLDGMDRSQLLLGSRPVDFVKSMLGISVGVNETGGAAIALMPAAEGIDDHSFERNYVAIVAVTDAGDFTDANFGGLYHSGSDVGPAAGLHPQLGPMSVWSVGSHVVFSPRRDALMYLFEKEAGRSFVAHRMGDDGLAVARQGDVFVYVHNTACAIHPAVFFPQIAALAELMPPMPRIESKVFSLDFDPLGLFIRGRSVLSHGYDEAKLSEAISEERGAVRSPMLTIPDRPFIIAGGINASIITSEIALTWAGKAWAQRLLDALAPARSADFAIYPAEGYFLNESMFVLRGGDGKALSHSLRELLAQNDRVNISWNDDRFEARISSPSVLEAIMLNALFGPAGPRGVIGHVEDGAYLVPSRREATLAMARDAAAGGADSLADHPVIQSMQLWMREARDIEMYIDLAELVPALVKAAPGDALRNAPMPAFERGNPPIGVAAEIKAGAAHWTIILPADVLAPLLDRQRERLQRRAARPQRGPTP